MPSIKDVAKRANVSIATVSHVVNKTKFVSEELKIKVNIAIKELGYVPDPIARNMKTKKTMTIGVITTDICGLFYPYIVKGIYEETIQKGYNIIIADTNGIVDRAGSFKKEMECFKRMTANRVDGIIFASSVSEGDERNYLNEINKLVCTNKKVALVSVERDFSKYGISSVFSNNFVGAKQAVEHLIDVGCKKIAHVGGPIYSKVTQDRLEGYKNAIENANLSFDDNMLANGDYTHQSGYIAIKEILSKSMDIDGIFVANDQMAVGVLKALNEFNLKVPKQIKVIGYDNVFISNIVDPPLSTINIRKKSMGIQAAKMLLKQIDNNDSELDVVELETRLVVRKSTVQNAPEDWILSDW